MATAVQTLVDEIVNEYGFDIDAGQALRALDRRHKTMVARSKSNRKTVAIGSTVAGQADYPLAAFEIYEVYVDGVPYGKAPRKAQRAYARHQLLWVPTDVGLWVSTADSAGVAQIGLIPPPDTAGKAITAFVAAPAADLVAAGNVTVDDDLADGLVEGVAATFLRRDTEQRAAAADAEQVFAGACEELRQRVARRARGSGPAQIRVQGINA